jgi:SAM-dependent methyltransferase
VTADASWIESMPDVYDRCLGPALFAPFAQRLAQAVSGSSPRQVLELAAGTGIATRAIVAALPLAEVTATDLNPAMVAWSAAHVPGATWRQADAQALPMPDGAFDAVVCQFGAMFFPDKAAAFIEAARVLRPGGTLNLLVWGAVERSDFPDALVRSLTSVFPDAPPDFVARIPHGYHDTERISADLGAGGFAAISIEPLMLRGESPSAEVLAAGFCMGTPLRFALEQRGDLRPLTRAVAAEMARYLGPGPVSGDLAALHVTARTPR